jgi:hypothetical protein
VYINSSNVAVASPAVLAFDGTNLGLGVTPSAWGSSWKAIESTAGGAVYFGSSQASIVSNAYNNNTNWVYKTTSTAGLYANVQGAHQWYSAPSGTAGNVVSFITTMALDVSANLGIGTSSPSFSGSNRRALTLNAPTGQLSILELGVNGSLYGYMYANSTQTTINAGGGTSSTSPLTFDVNGAERARIDTSGNLLVGQTSTGIANATSYAFQIDGQGIRNNHGSGTPSGYAYMQFGYAGSSIGSITQNGTTGVLYNLTSDYRLKNNQQPLTGAKDFIMALQPKKWQWWDGSGEGVGFVAHEFMEIAKYSGHGEKDAVDADGKPIYQSIQPSSSEVMANLVSFIQELSAQVTTLQTQINGS